jgi:transcriptional regulator with XRE-family HTH domain
MAKQRCNKDLLKKVAMRIKHLREERKVSQEIFFIDTDIHIARIETCKTNITISTLNDICDYFSISLSDFFSSLDTCSGKPRVCAKQKKNLSQPC